MNPQDIVNQQVRMLVGDLQINLLVANARIAELEAALEAAQPKEGPAPSPEPVAKPNGKGKEASP